MIEFEVPHIPRLPDALEYFKTMSDALKLFEPKINLPPGTIHMTVQIGTQVSCPKWELYEDEPDSNLPDRLDVYFSASKGSGPYTWHGLELEYHETRDRVEWSVLSIRSSVWLTDRFIVEHRLSDLVRRPVHNDITIVDFVNLCISSVTSSTICLSTDPSSIPTRTASSSGFRL